MKTTHWFLLLAVVLGACHSPEPIFPAPNSLSQVPFRIKTIRQQTAYNDPTVRDQDNTALYHYDSLGRVARIERQWGDRDILFQYQSDQLITRLTRLRRDSSIAFREIFEYEAQGKLTRLNWSGNGSQYVETFRYNAQGHIGEIRHETLNYLFCPKINRSGFIKKIVEFSGYSC